MKKIYYGGPIITMAEPLYAEALLTEGGRITAVGPLNELMQQADGAEKFDLGGRALMPAFIDPHSHFSQTASALLQVSLDGCDSILNIKIKIDSFIKQTNIQPGEWLIARDYDNNLFDGAAHPELEDIDSLCPGYKLVIHHKSGHMGLFNSEALKALGLTPSSPDIEGGYIGRQDGRLTGYLEENAFFTYLKMVPMPGLERLMDAYSRAQDVYASHGIATIQEGMLVKEMLPLYRELFERDILRLDLVAYASPDCFLEARTVIEASGCRRCRLGGIKIFLDGSPQGRTAWMRTPYLGGDEGYCGYGTMSDEQVESAFELAAREHTQLLAHCNGDAASAQFLRCLERAERKYPELKQLRPVIIHGQLIGLDQLQKAVELGAVVSFFVAHVYHWGETHIKNFGLQRAIEISPAASAKRAGLPFTFHQDSPVIKPDMLETIWCASSRLTSEGTLLGGAERISVREAMEAVTSTAAWQYGEEAYKGSLEPGKLADMLILERDPLSCGAEELRDIWVVQTIKGGKPVYGTL